VAAPAELVRNALGNAGQTNPVFPPAVLEAGRNPTGGWHEYPLLYEETAELLSNFENKVNKTPFLPTEKSPLAGRPCLCVEPNTPCPLTIV